MPDSFSVTVIDWNLAPGTTSCLDCGTVLATPNNVIPHEFATAHHGHNVQTRLAPTLRDLERAVIEAAIEWEAAPDPRAGDFADEALAKAVKALIAAREKQ